MLTPRPSLPKIVQITLPDTAVSDLFSPRQVAQALGVSESSLKRWCDKGLLQVTCTAGGHRRLALAAVLEFVRKSQHPLTRPELLGLPAKMGGKHRSLALARQALQTALVAGEESTCRRVVLDQYLAGQRVSVLGDDLLSVVFREVGKLWECGEVEVYQERRACQIMSRILHELRSYLPASPADAPLAIGGSPEGDIYDLPTTLVEASLVESGWRAISLGSNLPFSTLAAAINQFQPRLFWLSISHLGDEEQFLNQFHALAAQVVAPTAIVLGGRALHPELRQRLTAGLCCDSMQHLVRCAAALEPGASYSPKTVEPTAGDPACGV